MTFCDGCGIEFEPGCDTDFCDDCMMDIEAGFMDEDGKIIKEKESK
jgi:hypothetical protein